MESINTLRDKARSSGILSNIKELKKLIDREYNSILKDTLNENLKKNFILFYPKLSEIEIYALTVEEIKTAFTDLAKYKNLKRFKQML